MRTARGAGEDGPARRASRDAVAGGGGRTRRRCRLADSVTGRRRDGKARQLRPPRGARAPRRRPAPAAPPLRTPRARPPPRPAPAPHAPARRGRRRPRRCAPGGATGCAGARTPGAAAASCGLFGRTPTGYYGTVTAAAVRGFQQRQGLTRTGARAARGLDGPAGPHDHAGRTTSCTRPPARPARRPDPRCLTGRVMCISKKSRHARLDGRRQGSCSAMDVRFGSAVHATREGSSRVDVQEPRPRLDDLPHAMPYAMFFSGGQAVHYSSDFAARGYAAPRTAASTSGTRGRSPRSSPR